MPDTQSAISFLQALEPEGPWLLVAIDPDPPGKPGANLAEFSPGQEEQLASWINARQGKWNLYFTSNLPANNPFTTAKKDVIQYIRLLHVDVDLPGAADDEEASKKILSDIRSLDPPPTAIVFTGGGYQAIWLLAYKLPPELTSKIEGINTAIWRSLKADHCHDVSRLLRLPGTVNMPNAKKRSRGRVPAEAYLVEADWSQTWFHETDRVPSLPDDNQSLPDNKTRDDPSSGSLSSLPSSIRKLIKSGDATDFKNDRSRLVWFLINKLVRMVWTDEDITKLFLDSTNGAAAHCLDQSNPRTYITRNLERAREVVAQDWNRHPKTGEILTKDQDNIDKALATMGIKLSYDALADRCWVNGVGPAQRLSDEGIDALWLKVQAEFKFLPDKPFFQTVFTVRSRDRTFHPVLDYLQKNQPLWNGNNLIGDEKHPSWLTRYGGVEDTPYTRAVGRLTLVAAVRRMRSPGCKFDEMLMFVDPTQGSNKSLAIRTLAVDEDWFNDYLPLGEVGREVIEHVRGFWIIEAQEMAGMSTKDVERIKGFCSRQHDRGRMSYDRLVTDLPRSCVFIGTTNEDTLFTDLLNRRYWPVAIANEFDLDAMKHDLNQLWAEAAVAEAAGESIRLARELWPVAAEVQAKYRVEDSWSTLLDHHIGNLDGRITSIDLYKIINKQSGSVLHTDGRRLGRAMREIGFERLQMRDERSPNPRWYYLRGNDRKREILVFRDQITNELSVTNEAPSDIEPKSYYEDIPF